MKPGARNLLLGDGNGLPLNPPGKDIDELDVCYEEVSFSDAFGKRYAVSYFHGLILRKGLHTIP
jgi:hypothetical protein